MSTSRPSRRIDVGRSRLLGRRDDFAQRAPAGRPGPCGLGHRHGGEAFAPAAGRLWQAHRDLQGIAALAAMGVADDLAAQRRADES